MKSFSLFLIIISTISALQAELNHCFLKPTFESFEDIQKSIEQERKKFEAQPSSSVIYISILDQRLYYFVNGCFIKEYIISTSKNPSSCEENSFGTPWGLHKIDAKIGKDAPIGMVFQSREPIGKTYHACTTGEFCGITSRILRLRGSEPGLNSGNCTHRISHSCDTFDRYVYIHGTPHEANICTPQSKGCILLTNQDVVELFDLVESGTLVLIDLH